MARKNVPLAQFNISPYINETEEILTMCSRSITLSNMGLMYDRSDCELRPLIGKMSWLPFGLVELFCQI